MENTEMVLQEPTVLPQKSESEQIAELLRVMQGMAQMIRATHDRMAALEAQVRHLTKVTPAQATDINKAVRQRAEALCREYGATGCERQVADRIRRAIKLGSGASNVREIPACEYKVTMNQVSMWDDYKVIRDIKTKAREQKG